MKSLAPVACWLLLGITILQWFFITYLLQERHNQHLLLQGNLDSVSAIGSAPIEDPKSTNHLAFAPERISPPVMVEQAKEPTINQTKSPAGVAAAIFYSGPAWFHRRYPVLLQNVLANIPIDWSIQLFVHPHYWNAQVLPVHPGLTRLLAQHSDRIILTELPKEMQHLKQAKQRIPLDPWFWETLIADKVFMFSGNGMMCTHGNTQEHWDALLELDYVGVPWKFNSKPGGDGSTHSFRNRAVMVQVLEYAKEKKIEPKLPEHEFFVDTIRKMQKDEAVATTSSSIRLASHNDSVWFGGVQTTNSTIMGHLRPIPPPPMVVSGTQAKLTFQERDDLLMVCPELKVIFPSLHNPACFGAHPDPVACKAKICALQDVLPSSGC